MKKKYFEAYSEKNKEWVKVNFKELQKLHNDYGNFPIRDFDDKRPLEFELIKVNSRKIRWKAAINRKKGWAPIPHELLRGIGRHKTFGGMARILTCIIRYDLGFHSKFDKMPALMIRDFQRWCPDLTRRSIIRILKRLKKENYIKIKSIEYGSGKKYFINLDAF